MIETVCSGADFQSPSITRPLGGGTAPRTGGPARSHPSLANRCEMSHGTKIGITIVGGAYREVIIGTAGRVGRSRGLSTK